MFNIRTYPLVSGAFARLAFASSVSLWLIVLVFSPTAQAQSDVHIDDVRVVPRPAPAQPEPHSELVPVSPEPSVHAHTKPLRVDVDLVLVPVTVTDVKNRPVTQLQRQDFVLYEGEEQQQIRYFSTEDGPISLGVLLDVSRSMSNKIDDAKRAVAEFFKNSNPEDDYFVITFSDRPELLADSTQSIGYIQAKLATAEASGHTALLDAIYLGIAKMRHARYARRALLIISDGGDNHSRYHAKEIKRLVEEADVEMYAIGIFDTIFKTPEEWAGKRLLAEITEATGGRTLTLRNASKLPEMAANVSHELRSQYVLGYRPSRSVRDGKWRKIKVRLTTPRTPEAPLYVYSKKGYVGPGE